MNNGIEVIRRENDFDLAIRQPTGPIFTFAYVTAGEWATAWTAISEAFKAADADSEAKAIAALQPWVRNWRNVATAQEDVTRALPFDRDKIGTAIQRRDIWPVLREFISENNPREADLGNSPSPARLPQAESAETASTVSAETSRPEKKP